MPVTTPLIEREVPLATLVGLVQQLVPTAGAPPGRCVLVHGEAGVGKTALLEAAQQACGSPVRWWWGRCSAWRAPAPLGPLRGFAAQLPPDLAAALTDPALPQRVLPLMLAMLRQRHCPTVLVVDDAQWADGATLDLMHYLGRRIDATAALLVVIYRDDALEPGHPLQRLLGGMPADSTTRLSLRPLSRAASEAWARRAGHDPRQVYRLTGGNPFYLGELLCGEPGAVPTGVQQAVLDRAAGLSADATSLLELMSVVPDRMGLDLLEALHPQPLPALRRCVEAGLVQVDDDGADFRHALVRQALLVSLTDTRRRQLHARVCAALEHTGASAARHVHHAELAGLGESVCRWAPLAAAEATQAGAHRQAALLLALLRSQASTAPPDTVAGWTEAEAHACLLSNALDEAIALRQAALQLRDGLADAAGIARNLTWLSRLYWLRSGDPRHGLPWVERAVDALRGQAPSIEMARAHGVRSHLHLVDDNFGAALRWGQVALAVVSELDDPATLSQALNNVGTAHARTGELSTGLDELARSLAIAERHSLHEDVVRAHLNLFIVFACERRLGTALDWADRGVAHCEEQGLDLWNVRLRVRRAWVRMMAGRWSDADRDLRVVSERHTPSPMEAATATYVAAVLAVRRGEAGARRRLVQAVEIMRTRRVELWFGPTGLALAEAAWLDNDHRAVTEAIQTWQLAQQPPPDCWCAGEAMLWSSRAGRPPTLADDLPAPIAAELAGRHREAADAWESLGCRWDGALALLAGDADDLARAWDWFDALRAEAALRCVRRALRARGLPPGDRGPYRHARGDPLCLTPRQRRVLELLCEGLSNRQMAERLCRSERTVEGHVAALLARLRVRSRDEAVALAAATTFGGAPASRVRPPLPRRH